MSEKLTKTITCPKCGGAVDTEIVCSVNPISYKNAKEKIFNDTFFDWSCPLCGCKTQLMHPLLYNDIKRRFMVYYIPNVDRRQLVDDALEDEFRDIKNISRRVVPSISALKEKIFIFERKLNDMAVELTKLAVAELVSKSEKIHVSEGYLSNFDEETNSIGFEFFIGDEAKPFLQSTRLEVYKRSLEIVNSYFADENNRSGFIAIDRRWAREALAQYRKMR